MNGDDRVEVERSIDVRERFSAAAYRLVPDRGPDPIHVDDEQDETIDVAIERVGDASDLVPLGTMDEPLLLECPTEGGLPVGPRVDGRLPVGLPSDVEDLGQSFHLLRVEIWTQHV